jgi:hypothetical protein
VGMRLHIMSRALTSKEKLFYKTNPPSGNQISRKVFSLSL